MREQMLKVEPFKSITVLEYESAQEPNKHGTANVLAQISSEKEEEYLNLARNTTWFKVIAVSENGEEKVLFCGILKQMSIQKQSNSFVMKLELVTGTILLEKKEHIRSFQRDNLTYRDIINTCNHAYEDAATIMTVGKEISISHFTVQYKETDWDFLKRLCARNNGVLVPSHTVEGVKYFFGMPRKKEKAIFQTNSYTIINDETISYEIESREIHEIGETAEFMDKTFFIWKVKSKMIGNEIHHIYSVGNNISNVIQDSALYQERMTGASLYGTVMEVEGEQVKIKITKDENKSEAGSCWFPFSTVYSSVDGAGWYCMPEPGDKIRLYFPTSDESEAYVCSAVHEKEGAGIRTEPENKIWRNPYGKEIRLTPDGIFLTNNKGTSMELSDSKGIRIKSSGSVYLKASGRMQISSENAGIEVAASNRVRIQQRDTELVLQDGIQFTGSRVNIK